MDQYAMLINVDQCAIRFQAMIPMLSTLQKGSDTSTSIHIDRRCTLIHHVLDLLSWLETPAAWDMTITVSGVALEFLSSLKS